MITGGPNECIVAARDCSLTGTDLWKISLTDCRRLGCFASAHDCLKQRKLMSRQNENTQIYIKRSVNGLELLFSVNIQDGYLHTIYLVNHDMPRRSRSSL